MSVAAKEKVEEYKTVEDLVKKYLPNSYRKQLVQKRQAEPGEFGITLAQSILAEIRKSIQK